MSLEFYKTLHLFSLFLVFVSMGGIVLHVAQGGARAGLARGLVFGSHGVGLILVFVSGFGMLAKLGLTEGVPGWAMAKIALWLALGALIVVPLRAPAAARPLWFALPVLGGLGAWLAIAKPF